MIDYPSSFVCSVLDLSASVFTNCLIEDEPASIEKHQNGSNGTDASNQTCEIKQNTTQETGSETEDKTR